MSGTHRPEPAGDDIADGGVVAGAKSASTALVPLADPAPRHPVWRWSPSAMFVTHLIACADQSPQTRRWRRAAASDAQAAYRTRQTMTGNAGGRMRQTI